MSKDNSKEVDFLMEDFSQCFNQMRHYDSLEISVVKFAFTAYTTLIAASYTLYNLFINQTNNILWILSFILLVGFIFGVLFLAYIIRNRVYYVIVARYINEQRQNFLTKEPLGFKNNTRMYTDPSCPPYFNPVSTYSILYYILAILNTFLFAGSQFFLEKYLQTKSSLVTLFILAILILIAQLSIGIIYLISREGKSADKAVFGK